jgi:hypothetical protein
MKISSICLQGLRKTMKTSARIAVFLVKLELCPVSHKNTYWIHII